MVSLEISSKQIASKLRTLSIVKTYKIVCFEKGIISGLYVIVAYQYVVRINVFEYVSHQQIRIVHW